MPLFQLRGQMETAAVNEDMLSVALGDEPTDEAAENDADCNLSVAQYKGIARDPKVASIKAKIDVSSKSMHNNGVLTLDSSVVPQEDQQDLRSPKNSSTMLPLRKKVGYGRTPRFPKVPDGPENSSAVINVSVDVLDDKGSVKHNAQQDRALKTVARKTARSKKAQADNSVAKPVNEA